MITIRVILHVRKVLPSRVLLLEGQDGQTWKDHVPNYTSCHLPNVDGQIDASLVVVHVGLQCMLCGQSSRAATYGGNVNWQMVFLLVHPINLGS